ncbi:cytochrome P450 [Ktedonobacter sp. SOSP1-52]|uniref:cytochrome P450 n=1 Tax=Ktedonobacter sp. SOSP1-52 TaxID=2778366 RepID=UPI001916A9F0|nr:cytochrome P450 [Ktedonobacter sp. SOSP1-52]GHO71110.1 cytochrome P450 [Ktedonobacter sp. SOSP1-52]
MVTELETQEKTTVKPIPYIKESPVVGSLFKYQQDRLNLLMSMWREQGPVSGFHMGPFALPAFFSAEHVHSILVEHAYDFDKGESIHNVFRPVIGNGIFTSEGDFHRRQRKIMAPPFQPRHIASYADNMVYYGEQVQQRWQDSARINIDEEMTTITMSIIGKVLFNVDVFTETDELGAAMATTLNFVGHRLARLLPTPYNWPTPQNKRAHQAIALLRSRIQQMIEERRSSAEEGNDFLSILLRARDDEGKPMDNEQLIDECLTLFGAGHETTAVALTWAWYLLAQHPEQYRKLQEEARSVLGGRAATYADLAKLPYSQQVFKETLRMYPPAYAMGRAALKDIVIDGYQVHKGDLVLIAPYVMHNRPDYFPRPFEFDPERFTPEREKQLPRYAYLPFGAGPRICIGNYFAMMEGQLLLSTLAQHVTFELVPGQQITPDPGKSLTLRPDRHVQMVVRRHM